MITAKGQEVAQAWADHLVEAPDIIAAMLDCEDWRWYEGPDGVNLALRILPHEEAASEAYFEYHVGGEVREVSFQRGVLRTATGRSGTVVPMIQATIDRLGGPRAADFETLCFTGAFLQCLQGPLRDAAEAFIKAVDKATAARLAVARAA